MNNHLERSQIDFILVASEKSEDAASHRARTQRVTFEENLRKEGLVLEHLPTEPNGLSFVKIHAPLDVLKRYAEILKLRLPMKKVITNNEYDIPSSWLIAAIVGQIW